MSRAGKKASYHHGDLREALIEVAIELIAEKGLAGFSIAEASRRLGVTSAAPYRHFADRDALLAAVAGRAAGELAKALAAGLADAETPVGRLGGAATVYVRYAARRPSLFQALFASGLDKSRYPDLMHAAEPVIDAFLGPARELVADAASARDLGQAAGATAHGHAVLLLDGMWGTGPDGVRAAADATARAVRALAEGWA